MEYVCVFCLLTSGGEREGGDDEGSLTKGRSQCFMEVGVVVVKGRENIAASQQSTHSEGHSFTTGSHK